MIEFSGTAAQVQEAFHTPIQKYVVKGEAHWANASDPEIPDALAPVVAGVNSLHNFYKKTMGSPGRGCDHSQPGSRRRSHFQMGHTLWARQIIR